MTAPVLDATPRRQPTRRNVELLLLVFAWGIGLLGTLQVGWAIGREPDTGLWVTSGVVGLLALITHLIVRFRAPYADPIMLPVATLLTILGLVMIYRIDVAAARRAELNGNPLPTPDVYSQLIRSPDEGVAEFLDLAHVKPNTLGNTRMLKHL